MESRRWPTRRRDLLVLAACALLGILGLRGERVPLLGWVDLGFHELGHLLAYPTPIGDIAIAAAGSVLQIAVPLGCALYFLLRQRERTGGAVCLAWAATSVIDVARYVADAPVQQLPLIGGTHDWAFILGPHGFDVLAQAQQIAGLFTTAAWLLVGASAVVAVWPALSGRLHAEPVRSVGAPSVGAVSRRDPRSAGRPGAPVI